MNKNSEWLIAKKQIPSNNWQIVRLLIYFKNTKTYQIQNLIAESKSKIEDQMANLKVNILLLLILSKDRLCIRG